MLKFSSKEELYCRIKPALRAKKQELNRCGYSHIQEVDVWNYLIETKWRKSHALMLSDVVNDVLQVENKKLDNYVKEKLTHRSIDSSNLEVI